MLHIVIADLDEDRAGVGEEVAGDGEAVAQVGEVAVDAVAPGVAEGFDLLGLAGGVFGLAVLDVALAGADLPVGAELDAVGGSRYIIWTWPLRPSFSAREAMTMRESPRIMRFDQFCSCW